MLLATVVTVLLSFSGLFGIFWTFNFLKNVISHNYYLHRLPGPPKTNLLLGNLGHLHTTPDKMFRLLRGFALKHYPIYKLWASHVPAVNVVGPEDFGLILSSMEHIKKSRVYAFLKNWLNSGLLTSYGEKWQLRRKILTPTFHFSILLQFITVFNEETSNLVDVLKKKSSENNVISLNQYITEMTLKTIGETAMGMTFNFENTKSHTEYKNSILRMAQVLLHRLYRPWLYTDFPYMLTPSYRQEKMELKILHKFTRDVIDERQRNFKGIVMSPSDDETLTYSTKKRMAMLDLLLSVKMNEGLIDDEGIREEVDTFLFEGHDTTSVAITFGLMVLACNKQAQEKIVEEMREVLGDLKKKPTYNDLQNLKYMERCIKEILRLYPSVPFISRELGEDLVSNDGYLLPKGAIVHLQIYDLHHNPKVYPDPEKFDPDRFLPENCQDRHPFAYVPFSAGPRNCIGQRFAMLELKAVFCGILANFVLEPVDTPSSIVLVTDLVLRSKDPIKVKFLQRN